MIVAGVLCQVAGAGFPSNAPVEAFINFGITLVLVGGGIALSVLGILAAVRPSVATRLPPVSPLAFVAAVLVGIALLGFLFSLGSWMTLLAGVERARFAGLTGGIFFTGLAWSAGIVFGTVSLRLRTLPTRVIASVAVGIGLLLCVPAIAAAAVYSAGVTD